MDNWAEKNLSHKKNEGSFNQILEKKKDGIRSRGHLPYATVDLQLELLDQIIQFELGRFLLERGGLNGYWTDYVIKYPSRAQISGNNIETFLLNKAPTCLAIRERFEIHKKEIQKRVKEGVSFASIPCGVMADLLDVDYSGISNFKLTGIDIDPETLEEAEELAKEKKLQGDCEFYVRDAWNLQIENQFDLMTSSGLNIYVSDDEKVTALYHQFCRALKPKGCLLTSFLTPPPGLPVQTEWNISKIHLPDAQMQKLIFNDILDCKWQTFRTKNQTIEQLKKAGFEKFELIHDEAHIFPTIIATRS